MVVGMVRSGGEDMAEEGEGEEGCCYRSCAAIMVILLLERPRIKV